jgi:competence protein ComEC
MKKHFYLILIILFLTTAFAGLAFWRDNSKENKNEKTRIIFLDVGQGDAAMVDVGNNIQILVDGGDGKNILNKLGEHLPFYDRKIELVIMTHPDKDHIGGLVEVLKYYEVEQILETGIKCEKAICEEWDKLIEEKNIPVKYAQFGQRVKAGNIEMAVLYPFENLKDKEVKNSNDASIVLRLLNDDKSFLLTGDAGFPVENDLLSQNINLEARILKVSHHGSKYGTSNEFLKSVKPEKAIISVGKNSYGHPAKELLNRLKNINAEIFRTDEVGDVIFYY